MAKKLDEWEVENAKRTLLEAQRIQKNASLMRAIKQRDTKDRKSMDEVLSLPKRKTTPKKSTTRKKSGLGNQRYMG